ncbi:MAG: hypothetical protein JXA44_11675 [Methanospirillaceae archaeon]|nr:hypothetical protein [Methanospirillaceae archaeon]
MSSPFPIVLVHGWRSGPWIFNRLRERLETEGIQTWSFDYSRESHKNPAELAPSLSGYIRSMREKTEYTGQIDIISHSMGAMVSRTFCEVFNRAEGENRIRRWIGIAPVNHGAPISNLFVSARNYQFQYNCRYPNLSPEIERCMQDGAIVGNMTFGPFLEKINKAGLCRQIQYYVIAGHNPDKEYRFWPLLAGQTVTMQEGEYMMTYDGDGMVPNRYSVLTGHPFLLFSPLNDPYRMPAEWFNHNRLPRSPVVIDTVISLLLDR